MHFRDRRWEPSAVVREKTPVAVIPIAKLAEASTDVADIRLRQIELHVIVVRVPNGASIDGEGAVFPDRLFIVQILYPAEHFITGQSVFLFELRAIAVRDHPADAQLDPVFGFGGLFVRSPGR